MARMTRRLCTVYGVKFTLAVYPLVVVGRNLFVGCHATLAIIYVNFLLATVRGSWYTGYVWLFNANGGFQILYNTMSYTLSINKSAKNVFIYSNEFMQICIFVGFSMLDSRLSISVRDTICIGFGFLSSDFDYTLNEFIGVTDEIRFSIIITILNIITNTSHPITEYSSSSMTENDFVS